MALARKILMRVEGGSWTAPTTVGYRSETDLQRLLTEEPTLLPGVAQGSRAVTEFATRVGPSDIVVVGPDGDITIVECKLASNDEARRKIVGQVLDYAARIWKMPIAEFEARWVQRSGAAFASWLPPSSVEQLAYRLGQGQFRLILAVDTISDDLRSLVEFLNEHMRETVQILAVEFSLAHTDGVDILIPTVYGLELAEAVARRGTSTNWAVTDVMDWFAAQRPEISAAVNKFVERLKAADCRVVGTSAQSPSLAVAVDGPHGRVWPYALYAGSPKPSLNINVAYLAKAGEQAQDHFLRTIGPVLPELRAEEIRSDGYRRRPGIDPEVLGREGVIDRLVAAARALRQNAEEDDLTERQVETDGEPDPRVQ